MVEMTLNKIRIDEKSDGQMIVLREKEGQRQLPIIIGIAEVAAIKRNISGLQPPRPMTHDLLANVISSLGAKLDRVVIDKIEANTFYAKLILSRNSAQGREAKDAKIEIDARPSDSIALAIRLDAPIFAQECVLEGLSRHEQMS